MSGPQITHATTDDPSGDVYLHWFPPVGDSVQTYNIYVYSGPSTLYIQVTQSGSQLEEYIFTGSEKLVPGNYTFQMDYTRPDMSNGPAGTGYNYTVMDVNPPYAPGNVSAVGGSGQIQVGWEQQSGDSTKADAAEYDVIVIPSDPSGFVTTTTVTTTTATITGLSADTYSVKIVARSAYGNTAESTTVTGIAVTGGGGGGGGGGGNNGGGGHNNMATLVYNPIYEISTSYTEDVTVYGESAAPRADYNEDIAVNSVPLADLNAVLSFAKDGNSAASDFAIDLSGVSALVKTALDAKLLVDHPAYDLAALGVDARSILSHTPGSWSADVAALNSSKQDDAARNVYEQAADQGKLDTSVGKMNLAAGDKFVFYIKCTATQSLTVTTDATIAVAGASATDAAPTTTDKTTSSTTEHKYRVTMTAA